MRMQLNEAVSKRLTELLSARNMTQYQLFMKSGVPKSTIGNVINCSYESVKLPGYTEAYKPEFSSTATDFRVILKNVNYHLSQKDLVSDQDCDQVSDQDKSQDILHAVLDFCITEKSKQEICSFIGYRNLTYFTRKYLNPLLASGQLKMTIPDKPNSRKQKYITVRSE